MVKNGDNDNFQHPPSQSPLWFFSSCLDSIQPNLQREANCGHLTIWSRGLGIKSFPAQSEVPILLTASGKRHPGINPLPKYTVGAKDVAVTGGSRAVRIVICQGCSCERHRCREQNSLWASNWQGITWFSRARGWRGTEAVQHPSAIQAWRIMRPHEGQKGPKLLILFFVRERPAFAIVSTRKSLLKLSCRIQTLHAFQTALPLPSESRLPFNSVSVGTKNIYTYNEPKKIPRHKAPLFLIFAETMMRHCRTHVRLSLKSHYIVCRQ